MKENRLNFISIAMTTYNGAAHILEQLESIKNQTRAPDEVIICDDCSTDSTVQLIREFICNNDLKNWNIMVNKVNVGWRKNFFNAISKCTGDVIFFSDQDDIWYQYKIEEMFSIMKKYDFGCLYGKFECIDDFGNNLKDRNEQKKYTGNIKTIPFSNSFYMEGYLGCCMCVKRRVIDLYLKYQCDFDDHDSQCPRLAVTFDRYGEVDKPVIKYRMYSNNTSGISPIASYGQSNLDVRIKEIQIIKKWIENILSSGDLPLERQKIFEKVLKLEKMRIEYLSKKCWIVSLLFFLPYYRDFTMLMGDFSYRHKINKKLGLLRWKIKK